MMSQFCFDEKSIARSNILKLASLTWYFEIRCHD